MAKSYFAGKLWTPAESWRTIRTVRSDPPVQIAKMLRGSRRTVFQTALEQAQQQFAAASLVGYESRPLNLFYGLSQAGRALAAASEHLYDRNLDPRCSRWESTSHGLEFAPEGDLAAFWSQSVAIKPSEGDTFSRTSIAVESPFEDVNRPRLGALVAQLPEFTVEWPQFSWPQSVVAHVEGAPDWRIRLPLIDQDDQKGGWSQLQSIYPALRGLTFDGNARAFFDGERQMFRVPVSADRVEALGMAAYLQGASPHLGDRYLIPAVGGSSQALRPLMTWWLLLFSFSMLARYHPKRWTEVLALDSSKVASQVEHLLDLAISVVPEMIARKLAEGTG